MTSPSDAVHSVRQLAEAMASYAGRQEHAHAEHTRRRRGAGVARYGRIEVHECLLRTLDGVGHPLTPTVPAQVEQAGNMMVTRRETVTRQVVLGGLAKYAPKAVEHDYREGYLTVEGDGWAETSGVPPAHTAAARAFCASVTQSAGRVDRILAERSAEYAHADEALYAAEQDCEELRTVEAGLAPDEVAAARVLYATQTWLDPPETNRQCLNTLARSLASDELVACLVRRHWFDVLVAISDRRVLLVRDDGTLFADVLAVDVTDAGTEKRDRLVMVLADGRSYVLSSASRSVRKHDHDVNQIIRRLRTAGRSDTPPQFVDLPMSARQSTSRSRRADSHRRSHQNRWPPRPTTRPGRLTSYGWGLPPYPARPQARLQGSSTRSDD